MANPEIPSGSDEREVPEKQGRSGEKEGPETEERKKKKKKEKRQRQTDETLGIKELVLKWFKTGRQEGDEEKKKGLEEELGLKIASLVKGSDQERPVTIQEIDEEIKKLEDNPQRDEQAEEELSQLRHARKIVSETVAKALAEAVTDSEEESIKNIQESASVVRDETRADFVRMIEQALPETVRSTEVAEVVADRLGEEAAESEALASLEDSLRFAEVALTVEQRLEKAGDQLRRSVEKLGEELGLSPDLAKRIRREVEKSLSKGDKSREDLEQILDQLIVAGGEVGGEPIAVTADGQEVAPPVRKAVVTLGKLRAFRQSLAEAVGRGPLRMAVESIKEEENQLAEEVLVAMETIAKLREEKERREKEKAAYDAEVVSALGSDDAVEFSSFEKVNQQYQELVANQREAELTVQRERGAKPNGRVSEEARNQHLQAGRELEEFVRTVYRPWVRLAKDKLADKLKVVDRTVKKSSLKDLADRLEEAKKRGDSSTARYLAEQMLAETGRLRQMDLPKLSPEEEKFFEGYLKHYLEGQVGEYEKKAVAAYLSDVPETTEGQLERLQDTINALMRLGEAPDVLYYSPLWAELMKWLADPRIKPEVIAHYQAVSSVIMRFGRAIGASFNDVLGAADHLASWKIAALLKDERLALAYDLLEDNVRGRLELKSGLTALKAKSPEDKDRIKEELAREWMIRRLKSSGRKLEEINEEEKERLMTEAKSSLAQAWVLWNHMASGRYFPPNKDHWGVGRLLNYYERLMGSEKGDPCVVERVVGRKFVELWDEEKGEFVDHGFRLGLAAQNYYEYVTRDAISTLGLEKFQDKTGFSFVRDQEGNRVRRRVRIVGQEVIMKDEKGNPLPGCYLMRRDDGMEILLTTKFEEDEKTGEKKEKVAAVIAVFNSTASGLGEIHRYAKDAAAANWIKSLLRNLEGARAVLEDIGLFESPMGAELGTFGLESEPSKMARKLKKEVATHLPEIETQRRKPGKEGEWQRDPGVLYREDYFKEMCAGLLELARSREGRSRYEAYALAPRNRQAVILTAFARAGLITPEMEEELERRFFGPRTLFFRPRTVLATLDLYLVPLRIGSVRTMLFARTIANFFTTLFNYVVGSSK